MRKSGIFLMLILAWAILVSGCAPAIATSQPTTAGPTETGIVDVKADDLMSGVQAAAWPSSPDLPEEAASRSIDRFSASLLMASIANGGNIMISPVSVYLALAMTLNGADGETRTAMLKALAAQDLSADRINAASRDWITLLTATGGKTTLNVANSIWFDQNFDADLPFLQTNADFFAAGARKLDFRASGAPDVINSWVRETTKGTIDKIIDKIPENAVMYLINSIYFKADWQTPFDKAETRSRTFETPDGAIETAFLHRIGRMTYFAGLAAAGVALPYDDGRLAYFAILPDDRVSPRDWLASRDREMLFADIRGLMAEKADFTVELSLPKYESSYEDSLKNEMAALGMAIAFDPYKADFSLLNEQHRKNLFIGEIKHKTYIKVDEKGTEAAAVTSVEIRDESLPQSDKQLTLDRPFFYGIVDLKTGLPLFVGIMENPA